MNPDQLPEIEKYIINYYSTRLAVNRAGDTMLGNLIISLADPTLTLTDTGDSNSLTLTRSDTNALATLKNTVSQPSASWAVNCAPATSFTVAKLPSLAWGTVLGGDAGSCTISGWFKQNTPGGANDCIFGFAGSGSTFIFVRTGSTNQLHAVWGAGSGTTIVNTATSDR